MVLWRVALREAALRRMSWHRLMPDDGDKNGGSDLKENLIHLTNPRPLWAFLQPDNELLWITAPRQQA